MMKIHNIFSFITLTATLLFTASSVANQANNIESLINGEQGLENWQQIGSGNWRAENGAIVADAGNGFLVTKKSYQDFKLTAEFWADHTTNSGIFIRADDSTYINAYSAYEINIFDQRSNPLYGTGGIVGVSSVDPMPKAGGKWNTYEIVAKGNQLTVIFNGKETANLSSDRHDKGPVALQIGPGAGATGAIKWRKLSIESL